MEAISAVRRAIEAGGLIPVGSTVVVAVSGGVDSMVLLDVLARMARRERWRLIVGHVDHQLRASSAEDAQFVAAESARRRIGGDAIAVTVRAGKGGLAARAREARYAALLALARREEATVIATAHTANDQAETLLLRLLRGTGARGLAGIPAKRLVAGSVSVVRPLLGLTREDVLGHARRFGVRWREDPSNASPARLRNRVRAEVLPLLRALQPDVVRALARAATQAAEAASVMRFASLRALKRVQEGNGVVSREKWIRLPTGLGAAVMRRALAAVRGDAGTSAAQVEAACAAARKGRGRVVLEGCEVVVSRERITLLRR